MSLDPPASRSGPAATRRQVLIAGAAGLGTALAPATRAQAPGKLLDVRVGYIGDLNGASLVAVANKLGLWAKHGLKPDLKVFTNGPLQIQALNTKDLDFGYIGPGALWLPMTGRAKIIALSILNFADRVIAQPGIGSLQALRGKTVAVPEGTSGDMIVHLAMRKAKLEPSDYKRVVMSPSTIVTAFASGQVDAAGIWYPHVGTIKQRVPGLKELFSNSDAFPAVAFPSSYVIRPDLDSTNPQLVEAMVRLIKEANDWRAKHVKEVVQLTAALLNVPPAALEFESVVTKHFSTKELEDHGTNGGAAGWLEGMNELFVKFGRVPQRVDPKEYFMAHRFAAIR